MCRSRSNPQFIKTPEFLSVRQQYEAELARFNQEARSENLAPPPGLDTNGEEVDGVYTTTSTYAYERAQRERRK
jgi:hypothetical protein